MFHETILSFGEPGSLVYTICGSHLLGLNLPIPNTICLCCRRLYVEHLGEISAGKGITESLDI